MLFMGFVQSFQSPLKKGHKYECQDGNASHQGTHYHRGANINIIYLGALVDDEVFCQFQNQVGDGKYEVFSRVFHRCLCL